MIEKITSLIGDCIEVLPTLPADSVDACVTDPPYHLTSIVKRFGGDNAAPCKSNLVRDPGTLQPISGRQSTSQYGRLSTGFMGKQWDGGDIAFRPELWAEVMRVLKPGAHLLAFGGTRTYHRMACAIEDAGFEIRDCIQWLYGSGFPKSHDVSKGIDRAAGAEREAIGIARGGVKPSGGYGADGTDGLDEADKWRPVTAPATDAARQWQGWGTALKPSHEDLILAQKPYSVSWLCDDSARKLFEAICQLPSLANAAASNSPLSQSVYGAEFGFAQWSAVLACNTQEDLFALMDTLPSGLAIPLSLSIGLSWLAILAETSARESTFTTETASSLITDLKILNCLLSNDTPAFITEAAIQRLGIVQNVSLVDHIFSAVKTRLKITNILSAPENASVLAATNCQLEGANFSPNCEPIVLARKPLSEKTVAANVLRWGTGAINVDGCRVEGVPETTRFDPIKHNHAGYRMTANGKECAERASPLGRWPANVIHDGSEEVVKGFPESEVGNPNKIGGGNGGIWDGGDGKPCGPSYADEGSAARFFYTAKADQDDRIGSKHPTVKPLDLIQYLVRLVTPKGGLVLDPFAGTGTTGEAAFREGMRAVLIEHEAEYLKDIERRIAMCMAGPVERANAAMKAKLDGKPRDDGPLFAQTWDDMWAKPFDRPELV